jgi:hypothetical protein
MLAAESPYTHLDCEEDEKATSLGHLASLVEFFAVAETDTATDYRNGFRIGIRVWRAYVVRGKTNPLKDT